MAFQALLNPCVLVGFQRVIVDRTIGVVGDVMASKGTGISTVVIRNRSTVVLSHHVDVEIHQPLARHVRRDRPHTMRRVTNRAGKAILPHT